MKKLITLILLFFHIVPSIGQDFSSIDFTKYTILGNGNYTSKNNIEILADERDLPDTRIELNFYLSKDYFSPPTVELGLFLYDLGETELDKFTGFRLNYKKPNGKIYGIESKSLEQRDIFDNSLDSDSKSVVFFIRLTKSELLSLARGNVQAEDFILFRGRRGRRPNYSRIKIVEILNVDNVREEITEQSRLFLKLYNFWEDLDRRGYRRIRR